MERYFYRGQLIIFREIEFDFVYNKCWKFENFSVTQILREINFGEYRISEHSVENYNKT